MTYLGSNFYTSWSESDECMPLDMDVLVDHFLKLKETYFHFVFPLEQKHTKRLWSGFHPNVAHALT